MTHRLATAVAAASLIALASTPLYERLSWKAEVPLDLRERVEGFGGDTMLTGRFADRELYYGLRIPANRMVRINLLSSDFDPIVALYRARRDSVELLGRDDDGGEGNNSLLERCIEEDGVYLIRVSAFGTSRREGSFTLRASRERAECAQLAEEARRREEEDRRQRELERQRQADRARERYSGPPIRLGESLSSFLGAGSPRLDDGKPFEARDFACTPGLTFQFEVRSPEFDTYALIMDSTGFRVAWNDDGGGGTDSRIVHTCRGSETLHLVATTYSTSSQGGNYRMRVSSLGRP
jgi:hypothetical protein